MSKSQGFEVIGIAWLAVAILDNPTDAGTGVYLAGAILAFARAFNAWRAEK